MPKLLTVVDEQTVIEVLGQEVPDFTAQSISFRHAYKDRCIVEINTTLILKFPLCEEAQKWMGREYWILEALHGQTSVAVPHPFSSHIKSFVMDTRKFRWLSKRTGGCRLSH